MGIPQTRLQFSNKAYTPHHHAYSLADISLDTFPFSGMSIAIETALMGVPTVSLLGEGMHSRGAGRINHILGLDDLNTACGDEYIKKAVELASDLNRLEELRNTLREKVYNSELKQNPADFTKNLEEKYKLAWANFINSP
jgi:predicted O-linked N-acetylglucosamine transferase (SPINDLY family)